MSFPDFKAYFLGGDPGATRRMASYLMERFPADPSAQDPVDTGTANPKAQGIAKYASTSVKPAGGLGGPTKRAGA